MRTSESTKELDKAMAAAQAAFPKVIKESDNPYFKSRYADMASLINAVQEVLGKHGLKITQHLETEFTEQATFLCTITRLSHESGEFEESTLKMPLVDIKPQTMGSCSTYCRRYALQAVLRLAGEDDDGNAASLQEQWTDDKRKAYVEKKKQQLKPKLTEQLQASIAESDSEFISQDQRKMLFAIGKKQGLSEQDIRDAVGHCGYEHTSEIPKDQFNKILDYIDPDFKHHQQEPF